MYVTTMKVHVVHEVITNDTELGYILNIRAHLWRICCYGASLKAGGFMASRPLLYT